MSWGRLLYSLFPVSGWLWMALVGFGSCHLLDFWIQTFLVAVGASPNSKIPALIDDDGPGGESIAIMESAAIMVYLSEKYPEKGFLPIDPRLRSECLQVC